MPSKKIGCPSQARISISEQIECYIQWIKTRNKDGRRAPLTHIHVYPLKAGKDQKYIHERLRDSGFKLIEV